MLYHASKLKTNYLTPTSEFKQAGAALLQSAADYDEYNSTIYKAVEMAWNQVGIK
ncbi:M4 family metallopeptidase [Bacillus tropicus]|nr:M4 family metallopeptidase [Bacillus tropicus]MEC2926734.1 M4 family metallopeptidase [Bacillus tropicus]MEC3051239.1 M4 family metallopeptidase [Bacillus tropicus]MEC3077369.1 M4 family metallopeptidase [Bacillus tropicus]MEC3108847.1 M4 family metallopeptidase [Bacillus tropicus]